MSFKSEPKPIEVKALMNYLIYIKFENGEEKIYDMKKELEYPFYENLKDLEKFKRIKISGINIEWENGEDVAPENLYNNSKPIDCYNKEELIEINQ